MGGVRGILWRPSIQFIKIYYDNKYILKVNWWNQVYYGGKEKKMPFKIGKHANIMLFIEISVSKNLSRILNEAQNFITNYTHAFYFISKCEIFFNRFCEDRKWRPYKTSVSHWRKLSKDNKTLLHKNAKIYDIIALIELCKNTFWTQVYFFTLLTICERICHC